jgi:hypothetical protein
MTTARRSRLFQNSCQLDSNGKVSDFYTGRDAFDFRLEHRWSWFERGVMLLLSHSWQIPGHFLTLHEARIRPHTFQLLVNDHPIIQCCIFQITDVINWTTYMNYFNTGSQARWMDFDARQGQNFFLIAPKPPRGPQKAASFVVAVGSFHGSKEGVALSWPLPPTSRLKMRGAIPPVPFISSWSGV